MGNPLGRQRGVVFLNGKTLDRGTLELRRDSIVFEGWQGKAEIPLRSLQGIELGASQLPERAGIPVVGSLWPGELKRADTLLLTVQENEHSPQRLAVVANVGNGEELLFQILMQQDAMMADDAAPPPATAASGPSLG